MIFSCETSNLNKAIQTVLSAISSKPSTPVFGGIHIIAENNKIELQGMDINLSISTTIDAQIEEDGEILISAHHFSELVKKMNGETIKINKEISENTVRLQSGKADFKILLMNVMDYPKFPQFNPERTVTIEDEKIKDLIKKTSFACSTDVARPLFTGVLCEIEDGVITFVGTNTHRLAIRKLSKTDSENMNIIIPGLVLKEINKNLSGKLPQEVKISLLNNQIMVVIDETIIVSRLIEGKFPDYRKVIPPSFSIKTKVKTKELAGAVERVALFSSSDSDYSIVKISVDEKEMTVLSSSPEVGKGEEKISCETEGERVNVAFNASYILDILNNITSEEAIIELNSSLSPVAIKPIDDENYIYIVTPVRVIF